MSRKYELISELYDRTCKTVVSNPQNWQNFLQSACRNYKLRYDEQLLIYAQRPDATAVLEIERWNKSFGRWVNKGARGIAVFADENRARQRLTHYFDISDTHESRYSRPVPLWDMRDEYTDDVIETLESTFGELDNKVTLGDAVMSAAQNAAEDNLPDYLNDLIYASEDSFLEGLDETMIASLYKKVVTNSVAYMIMTRLGIDTGEYFEADDFRDVTNFNTQDTMNALGFATSDIAEMGLSEISKTVMALNRQNRIIEANRQPEYNKDIKDERSSDYERDNIHDGRGLQSSEPDSARTAGGHSGQMVADEENLSEGTPQGSVLQSPDERDTEQSSVGSPTEGDRVGGNAYQTDGGERGTDGTDESGRYDELGSLDEQHQELSTGNRESTGNIRLEYYDRSNEDKSLPFFGKDDTIREILGTTPHLSASLEDIKDFYERNSDSDARTEYIKSIFNNDYTELTLDDGRTVGYKTFQNVLHLWKGHYDSRTAPLEETEQTNDDDIIGKEVVIDDRRFVIESVGKISGDVSMRDVTFEDSVGFPINRVEKIDYVRSLLAEQTQEQQLPDTRYEYHLGDTVYIGASEYEILSFDDERVMLYDTEMPLFNKEFSRGEFDRKVQENPLNDHLRATSLPAEEKAVAKENISENSTETEQNFAPNTSYNDAFFLDDESQTVTWMYYNPDSNSGGQYVTNTLSYDDVIEAARQYEGAGDFFDYLGSIANQTLADVGTEWFEEADNAFKQTPDLTGCTSATMEALLENAERSDMVVTNIGKVPIEEYREIVAVQNGFDSYDEMYNEGIRIGNGYDKEPEPIVPAWEKKKKEKVKSFDLHPDVPMAERNNFDLSSNPVEQVGKKERFHRNMEAIKVLKECEFENRFATPEEQLILSKYVGWGGLSEAFDENNSAWADEFVELYTALSPEEYAAARESTLTAFYTPPEVTDAIYKAMEQMGFKEGNLLEPSCGIGNFIGMLPESMRNTKIYGVELDKISAGIAQQLYQKSSIAAQGFEEVNVPDSFFEGVVGNVPFGDFKVLDKRYDKYNFLIHDYFFAKSLDKLRPGGVMALVTSKGTMDKTNSSVRKYIAQRADLLGAIRLPNDTFKGNAGTEVVSDILFLQKRDRLIDIEPDWVQLGTTDDGITMNSYFVEHPEMILGEMKTVSGRFGEEVTCVPFENADLSELLSEAVANIHGEINDYEVEDVLVEEDNSIPADPNVRNFSYTVVDDKIYFRENSRMTPVEVSATSENRIKGMIAVRDSVRNLIELQTEDYPDEEIKAEQSKLNSLYDGYTKKYGLINSRANISAFSDDSSFALLSALEVINENGELERKADMFFKRTIKPHKPIEKVDTASEALAVSMGEKAGIDMAYMSRLTGKNEETLYQDLKGVIFLNPLHGYGNVTEAKYLMADEYLSGNVREKLITARKSAEIYPEDYKINVEALEKVQPKDLTASEISVRLGATWLPQEVIQQFMFEFLDTPRYAQWNIKIHFSPYTGEWNIEGKSYDRSNVKAYSTYGTGRINAYKIIEETLNLKDVRIFDYIEDDEGRKKAVLNKKETAIAQAKQEFIKQGFQDWIWADPDRREKLTKMYNEKFNSIRPREYDGSHITFSGMNPEITLREHQRNAVAHILYGGNTLLAHAVGAGKTFEMVAASQESKRLGLCNKSLFVVPNHLTEQWAAEYLQLYPSANILVATKKDFETKNRKKFCGRIATGDYDAVIIGHSQFEKIPMSIERQRVILEQQLNELTEGIAELKRNRGENFSVKQLEKSRKSVKQKLQKLNDQSRKDDVVTFEELGVDRLFIDESHYYKNLYLYTKMRNVGGIAQTEAQKSSDLFMKCRYLDEITGGRGTVFATGTPISNSMVVRP